MFRHPTEARFTDITEPSNIRGKQSKIRTSPNCLFPSYDNTLGRWDLGGFCQVERLTGGACVGDLDGDGFDDIYYARMDGHDIVYRNNGGNGTFQDISKESKIVEATKRIHSNGCLLVDFDNDGDLDIYISTVGNARFYAFVNNGFGQFKEEAIARGLANRKKKNVRTAGFTIAAADVDHDGLLDIMTTEWLPWLDKEGEHPEAPLDSTNTTNVRLFLNQGKGFFKDATHDTGVVPRMRAPRELFLTTQCDELMQKELRGILLNVGVPVLPNEGETSLRQKFRQILKWLTESGMTFARSDQSKNVSDTSQYVYYTIDTPIQSERDRITILGTLFNGNSMVVVASPHRNTDGSSVFPTVSQHEGMADATPGKTANMTIKLAPSEKLTIGVVCTDGEHGCEFDLMYIIHADREDLNGHGSSACDAQGEVMEKGWDLGQIGAQQQTPHTEPWLKSEYFINIAVKQMVKLGYKTHIIRATLRKLFRQSNQLDAEVDNTLSPLKQQKQMEPKQNRSRQRSKSHKHVAADKNDAFNRRLVEIYAKYNPDKLREKHLVKKLVQKYHGRESVLLKKLKKKYSPHAVSTLFSDGPEIWGMEFEAFPDGESIDVRETNTVSQDQTGRQAPSAPDETINSAIKKDKTSMHFFDFPSVGAFLFGATFSDLDNDTYPDLVFSGDFGTSSMLWNTGNGGFTRGHFHFLEDVLDNSMGTTVGDWNLDGHMDVLFTSISISKTDLQKLNSVSTNAGMLLNFRGNHLYQNMGDRRFEDVTDYAAVRDSGWGWGSFFFDMDNDGDLDIINGNGLDDPETTDDDWAGKQEMRLYVNQGADGKFVYTEEARVRGIANEKENRGTMVFDFDHDGDLDILVVNHGDTPSLYRNDGGNYYDWLRVSVHESCGRHSIGAKVTVDVGNGARYVREIGNTAAFLGQSESTAHFGLGIVGEDVVKEVIVLWPPRWHGEDPAVTRFRNVPIRSTLVAKRKGFGAYNTIVEDVNKSLGGCLFGQAM